MGRVFFERRQGSGYGVWWLKDIVRSSIYNEEPKSVHWLQKDKVPLRVEGLIMVLRLP